MKRVRLLVAATLAVVSSSAGVGLAGQATQPPTMPSVLAGKKFVPPARGEVTVEHTPPATTREKGTVITKITVRNTGSAPIARLTFTETWYDKGGTVVTGNKGSINGLLQPGEIKTITIETPYNPKMNANRQTFTHANGTVRPTRVPKIEVPKDAAAAPATGKPAPAATKK